MSKYLIFLLFPLHIYSQDTILIANTLPEIEFYEEKKESERLYNPQQIVEIDQKKISQLLPSTTADILQKSGEVMVQMSQSGGGSPIVRGFEASRVLLVVDGVRMNNAIFRSGHLQNSISTSPFMLNKMDIIFGPASVKYGSDALGGVIYIHTKTPKPNDKIKRNFYQKYTSVNQGISLHFDQSWSQKKWSYISGFTLNKYGNLKMGGNRLHGYKNWGNEEHIVDGKTQLHTGYNQIDLIQKIRLDATQNLSYLFNIQYSSTTNLDRFDKLNDLSNDQPKFEQWYYGPQKRLLASISTQYQKKKLLFDQVNNKTSYQEFDESRHSKKFGKEINERFEKVFVLSNTTDLTKKIGYNSLNYGFDIQNNYVQSTASQNTTSRYADGGSTMNLISAYAQYKKLYGKESNYVSTGIRYNKTILSASFKDTSTYKLPFNEINTNNNAVTASLGWKTKVNKNWTISTSISSGFRSPNVDDITKVFEKSGYVTVPNQNLKPEYSYNAEANVNAKIAKTSWTFSTYYTLLKDAIVKSPYSLNGQDSLFYDGEFFPIIANTNTQEANIYGVYTKMKWEISKNWLFANTLNKTIGQNISNNTPLDHIPPLFVKSEMQWHKKNNRISFYAMYNDWKKANQYSLNGSDNFNEATTDGNPAWWTINAQISSQLNSSLKILVAIENILDVHYKTYSSGISSPGRNFIISLNASF